MVSYFSLEQRVPKDHTLRTLRALFDRILANMSALLVQILFTIRSEHQLVEQLGCNLLFRWFVGLGINDAEFDRSVFSIKHDCQLDTDVARQFFRRAQP
jgi:transposase